MKYHDRNFKQFLSIITFVKRNIFRKIIFIYKVHFIITLDNNNKQVVFLIFVKTNTSRKK